jgi:hypothetical protein
MRRATVLVGLLFLTVSRMACAESFQYQPGMNVALGSAWNPATPFDVAGLGGCLQYTKDPAPANLKESFNEQFVDNYSQLESAAGVAYSSSASARFGIAKASAAASFSALRSEARSDRSVIYVVRGSRSYEPVRVKTLELTAAGVEALAKARSTSDSSEFFRPCGSSVVTSITKAADISLVYVFKASSAALREKIKAAVTAAVSTPKVNAQGALNIFSEVQKVDSSIQVSLEVLQSGTIDNTPTVRDLVGATPGSISEIRERLKQAVGAITWENAGITAFTADPIDKHLNVVKGDSLAAVLNAYGRIDSLRETSNRLVARYLQLRDVLSDADVGDIVLKPGAREQVTAEIGSVDLQLDSLVSTARTCLESPKEPCKAPFQDISRRVLQWVSVDYGSFSTWAGEVQGARYENVPERVRWTATIWPVFTVMNLKYVKQIALEENGRPIAVVSSSSIPLLTKDGALSWQPRWSTSFNGNEYCFRGQWGEVCNPRAADRQGLLNSSRANSNSYRIAVVDVEGGVTYINAPVLPTSPVRLLN